MLDIRSKRDIRDDKRLNKVDKARGIFYIRDSKGEGTMQSAPGGRVTIGYPRQVTGVTSYFEHNEFCNTRQVADTGAASLVEPCRVRVRSTRGVTTDDEPSLVKS